MYYDRPKKRRKNPESTPPARKKRTGGVAVSKKPPVRGGKKTPVRKGTKPQPPRAKAKKPAPRKSSHPLLRFVCFLLILLLLIPAGLYFLPQRFFNHRSPASYGAGLSLPEGYTHVLLVGLDKNDTASSRSDTMVILSVGKERVCLTSLMRDTGVTIPGKSGIHRLNAAYSYGGAELLLKTINKNFGLDLTSYVAVDYESFPPLIDILGGVDIEGISQAEVTEINHNVYDVLRRRYDAGQYTLEEATELYNAETLSSGGDLHLDGLQALGYARIRKTDSDYGRTNRQRKVLTAAMGSLKKSVTNPVRLIKLIKTGLSSIRTNMSRTELFSLGIKAIFTNEVAQHRLPADGTFKDGGSMFEDVDYKANYRKFLEYVYGK